MEVKNNTPAPPLIYEWDLRNEQEERGSHDDRTLKEHSSNDDRTLKERSINDDTTCIKRSMNGFQTLVMRVWQTANATTQRIKALKVANETPKAKVYANVNEWLLDPRNIQDATNNLYKDVEDLTDNPPKKICDALMEAGLGPEDKTQWTPQNLMPVVFSVKYELLKKRYYSPIQFWSMTMALVTALFFALGWWGPQKKELSINPEEPFVIDSAIARYQRINNVIFSEWRTKQIIDTCSINNWNDITQYLNNQLNEQTKSIKKQSKIK